MRARLFGASPLLRRLAAAFALLLVAAGAAPGGEKARDLPPYYNYLQLAECLENYRDREFFECMQRLAHVEKTREIWFILGLLHEHGIGTVADTGQAAYWYEKADLSGYDFPRLGNEAGRALERLRAAGGRPRKNIPPPFTADEEAVAARGTAAMLELATRCLQGLCAQPDWERSRYWEERAAAAGDAEAIRIVRENYQLGLFAYPYDPAAAPPPPEPVAEMLGSLAKRLTEDQPAKQEGGGRRRPRKVTDLALDLYREGVRTFEAGDSYEAGLRFTEAAAFGVLEPDNYFRLAVIQDEGGCGERNAHGAGMSFRIAAEMGHGASMLRLAMLHENGDGVRCSRPEAEKWYAAAQAAGSEVASKRLADLAARPGLLPGEEWRHSAAFKKLVGDAQFRASFNHSQYKLPEEMRLAREFLFKAARSGHAEAQRRLDELYNSGDPAWGIPADPAAVKEWPEKAAAMDAGGRDAR